MTEDKFEIDTAEIHYPNDLEMTLHNWDTSAGISVGFASKSSGNLTQGFHGYGVSWTPATILYEVDG